MKLIDPKDLKKYILENYDQISIFAIYLDIPETDINYCLENTSNKVCNPIRDDRDPSLGFKAVMDTQTGMYKLKMYDFADPYYRGDCFDLVGIIRSLHSNKGAEFVTICNDIMYTMKNKTLYNTVSKIDNTAKLDTFTEIQIEPRLWNNKDINLWNSFGLPFNENKHLIFPLKRSFVSNYCDYTYTEDDPGYAWISGYYEGKTLYTLYFPFRKKDSFKPRFKKNNKFYPLENIHELKPADILVITKAYKEKLLIKRILPRITTEHTIQVTNFTSESIVLSKNFALQLYNIYPTVVTNTDFDYTGLTTSGRHKREYGMIRFIPTNGRYNTFNYGGKDLCDIHDSKGFEYCVELVQISYNYLKQEIYEEIDKFN